MRTGRLPATAGIGLRPQLYRRTSSTLQERYNSSESVMKKEIQARKMKSGNGCCHCKGQSAYRSGRGVSRNGELSLRGMIALPTIRNTAGFDIIAASRDGKRHANIQVKTSSQRPTFLPICWRIESVKDGPDDYYVLLRRNPTNDAFQGYMLTGREMKEKLAAYEAPYTKNRQERKFNLCLCLYVDQALQIEKEDLESLPLERMRK